MISVIIPTVDRREQLQRAVEGVLKQQASHLFEVIIVDNSATGSQRWILDVTEPALQSHTQPGIRYFHEPNPGLASARNRGIAEARGDYIVFLDDDEWPLTDTWLEQLVSAALISKAAASFGPVYPQFEHPPERFARYVLNLYTRDLKRANGARVTDLVSSLGTGNSCFHKQSAFGSGAEKFSTEFDKTGGEDVDLLLRLRRTGHQFVWAANAAAAEFVPSGRLEARDLALRRFRQGQQRAYLKIASQRNQYGLLVFWMAIGAAQVVVHASKAVLCHALGNNEAAILQRIKMQGGFGKVLWQARFRRPHYGA